MATFTVTNLFDSGSGSLRDFISNANDNEGADTIDFDTELNGTINLTGGELGISDDLTINGPGAELLTLDAGGNSSIFNVDDGNFDNDLEVAIKGLKITGGKSQRSFDSGGISNQENLTVINSTISGNTASAGGGIRNDGNLAVTRSKISGNTAYYGGGIRNNGNLTITNSTISDNSAVYIARGGGIDNIGNLTVTNSTISGNSAYSGGGILNSKNLTLSGTTISGNSASYSGGGISNVENLTVTNSTISGNTAFANGGGIANYQGIYSGPTTVTNSTISGNSAGTGGGIFNYARSNNSNDDTPDIVTSSIIAANTDNKDIDGAPFTSGGNNLIGNGGGAEGFTNGENGDIVGTPENPIDPLLGELQDNGGPTQTQALLPGSPVINAGSNPLDLEFDQRGSGFNRVIGAQADMGAVEAVPEPDSTLGLLGVLVLGVMFLRKRKQKPKDNDLKKTL